MTLCLTRDDRGHRRRRFTRRQVRQPRDVRPAHRGRHVHRQVDPLPNRLQLAERDHARALQRVHDLRRRRPRARSALRAALAVRAQRDQEGQRVHARAAQRLAVDQARGHRARLVGQRPQDTEPCQHRQVAHERGQGQVEQQRPPDGGVAQVVGRHHLAREGARMCLQQTGGLGRRLRALQTPERIDLRQLLGVDLRGVGMRDPLQEMAQAPARGGLRMRQPQHVAVAPSVAPAVLEHLVRQPVDLLVGVPASDRALERPAPAAHVVDEGDEVQQVRPGARDPRQRGGGGAPRLLIAEARGHRQREQRRVVLRRPAVRADVHESPEGARPVRGEAAADGGGVVQGQGARAGVVGAGVGPENQETLEPGPVGDGEDVPAGGVAHHLGLAADHRLGLPRRDPVNALENLHRHVPVPAYRAPAYRRRRSA